MRSIQSSKGRNSHSMRGISAWLPAQTARRQTLDSVDGGIQFPTYRRKSAVPLVSTKGGRECCKGCLSCHMGHRCKIQKHRNKATIVYSSSSRSSCSSRQQQRRGQLTYSIYNGGPYRFGTVTVVALTQCNAWLYNTHFFKIECPLNLISTLPPFPSSMPNAR